MIAERYSAHLTTGATCSSWTRNAARWNWGHGSVAIFVEAWPHAATAYRSNERTRSLGPVAVIAAR